LVETEALSLMDGAEARAAALAATESGLVKVSEMKRFADSRHLQWGVI